MRALLLVAVVVNISLPVVVLAQTRTDDFSAADVQVSEIVLTPLADGGCAARWTGGATSADGGATVAASTDQVDLRALVNQNRCNGLAAAGVPRLANRLRFPVDAGSP